MSPFRKPTDCASEPSATADNDDALGLRIEAQLVGERRRQIGDRGAKEWRPGLDLDLLETAYRAAPFRAPTPTVMSGPAASADLRRTAERLGAEAVIEGVRIVDRCAVDTDQEVAGLDAGARGRPAWNEAGDERAGRTRQAPSFRLFPASPPAIWRRARPFTAVLPPCADATTIAHQVGRNREADALRAAGARDRSPN